MPFSPFVLAAIGFGAFGAILVIAGLVALFRWRPLRFLVRTLLGLVLLSLGALSAAVALGIQGYHALTREEVAARISVRPAGPQKFGATVRYPDGREQVFDLAGDEIYVDAHILKWKPIANVIGLHTAYELDRVSGRYQAIEQERSAPRTVYLLREERPVELFRLRQRYAFLAPLYDAEYGSATFVQVKEPAELEVRVSTSGLLVREAKPQ
ncbi:MAG: hypothetical protein E6H57_11935 [Betaproteobacteria bacterium]|nr:MAG: hypothetical protein E6H57_11935 [Betaproteobacteria bacterium]